MGQLNEGEKYNLSKLLKLQADAIVELSEIVEPLAANTQVIVNEVEVETKSQESGW